MTTGYPVTAAAVSEIAFAQLTESRPGRVEALERVLVAIDGASLADARAALLHAWHVVLTREANAHAEPMVVPPALRVVRG